MTDTLKSTYPAGEYTIRIWGRTREIGVHKIIKAQYDYWSDEDNNDDLPDALSSYDENEDIPEEARFNSDYYDLNDTHSFYGYDQDDTVLTITNSEGVEVYKGSLIDFVGDAYGDDFYDEGVEELEEIYPDYLGKGCFLIWKQGGKGSCMQGTIIAETDFDPRKMKIFNWDIEGTSYVHHIEYDGELVDDEGMDSEHDNWRGKWADYQVYENV